MQRVILVILAFVAVVQALHPIIFLPGDSGNKMWAKLDKPRSDHPYCVKHWRWWYLLWLKFDDLDFPLTRNCFLENIQLHYDFGTRTTKNTEGVETKVDPPGEVSGMKTLDLIHAIKYFGPMIDKLVDEGYREGKDLAGVSYDWRKAANENKKKIEEIVDLVEKMYHKNNGKSVYIISHSLGGLMAKYLLENASQEWKDKYIKGWIAIAAPLYGAPKVYELMASGYNMDIPIVPAETVKYAERSWPSSAWLLPNPEYWDPKEPIIQTPQKNYTVQDYPEFFNDIGFNTGMYMFEDTHKLLTFAPPEVDLYCIYGTDVKTPAQFIYNKKFSDKTPKKTVNTDGDGTVPLFSAKACGSFDQEHPIQEKSFSKTTHTGLLKDDDVISYVSNIVFG